MAALPGDVGVPDTPGWRDFRDQQRTAELQRAQDAFANEQDKLGTPDFNPTRWKAARQTLDALQRTDPNAAPLSFSKPIDNLKAKADDENRGSGTGSEPGGGTHLRPSDWEVDRAGVDARGIAGASTEALRSVQRGLYAEGKTPDDPTFPEWSRIAGAEIAAVAAGRKPMFHEQYFVEPEHAAEAAAQLRKVLPGGIHVEAFDNHLTVYDPAAVERVMATDPAHYGTHVREAVKRAVESGDGMGELLGFGARNLLDGSQSVSFLDAGGNPLLHGFTTHSEHAREIADHRAKALSDALGQPVKSKIVPLRRATTGELSNSRVAALPQRIGVSAKAVQTTLDVLRQSRAGKALAKGATIVRNLQELLAHPHFKGRTFTPEDLETLRGGEAEGFYDPITRRSVVLTDHVGMREDETPSQAIARVLIHERVGHEGLTFMREASPIFDKRWREIMDAIPKNELAAIADNNPHLSGDPHRIAEEWFARQVEKLRPGQLPTRGSLLERAWNAIKETLGRLFLRREGDTGKALNGKVRDLAARILEGHQDLTNRQALQHTADEAALSFSKNLDRGSFDKIKAGDDFNANKKHMPPAEDRLPQADTRGTTAEREAAVRAMLEAHDRVTDPDGRVVRLTAPENLDGRTGVAGRAWHLISSKPKDDPQGRRPRELRQDKLSTVMAVPRTIADYTMKVDQGGKTIYVRRYAGKRDHMVVVSPRGEVVEQGFVDHDLTTQRPLDNRKGLEGARVVALRRPNGAFPVREANRGEVRGASTPVVQPRARTETTPNRGAQGNIPQNRELRNANVAREATSAAQASALDSKHPEASPLQDIKTKGSENLDLNFGNRYDARRPHEDELRQTPPLHVDSSNPVHRNAFRRAVAARIVVFETALRALGAQVVPGNNHDTTRVRATAIANGELRVSVRDDIDDGFWIEARGHSDIGLNRLRATLNEELTHIGTLKVLRDEWLKAGGNESFVGYIDWRSGEVLNDAIGAVESLAPEHQAEGREALWSAWKAYFGKRRSAVTPDNIVEHLSDRTARDSIANDPAPFILETVRQLVQMRNYGRTTETAHSFLDRLTDLGSRILNVLKSVAQKLSGGILGKQMNDLVERTESALKGGGEPFIPVDTATDEQKNFGAHPNDQASRNRAIRTHS